MMSKVDIPVNPPSVSGAANECTSTPAYHTARQALARHVESMSGFVCWTIARRNEWRDDLRARTRPAIRFIGLFLTCRLTSAHDARRDR